MNIDEARASIEEHMLAQADSVGELLEQFKSRIPSALIGGPGWDKLIERTNGLPISLATAGFGFEFSCTNRSRGLIWAWRCSRGAGLRRTSRRGPGRDPRMPPRWRSSGFCVRWDEREPSYGESPRSYCSSTT